jgi:hypothetical protein
MAIAGMTIIHSDSVVSIERGTSCFRMKASKNCRAFFSSSRLSASVVQTPLCRRCFVDPIAARSPMLAAWGSCVRWPAFTPCSKGMPKWSCVPLFNHPTVTRGPRCRYLLAHKASMDTRQHVMANHIATTQEPDEAAHFSCKVRSSWLTGDNELGPTCCQAKQASQTVSGKVM